MVGNSTKLCQESVRLDIRKILFTVKVVRPWNGLPSGVADAPCLSVLKRHFDNALSDRL